MSRKFALLAAALAFCGLASVAQAQGSGGTESSSTITAGTTGSSMRAGTAMRGRTMRAQRPMRPTQRAAMRGNARSGAMMRGGQTANADRAYMGGGAVYERGADGSLRPAN